MPGVFHEGKDGRCVGLTTLPPSCAVVMKSGNLNFLEPSGPFQACNGTALPFPLPLIPDLNQINPFHIPLSPPQDMFKLILSTSGCVFQALPVRHGFNRKPCTYLSSAPYVPHAPQIASSLIISRYKHLVWIIIMTPLTVQSPIVRS